MNCSNYSIEFPRLNLALEGFSAEQIQLICSWLDQDTRMRSEVDLRWKHSPIRFADALVHFGDPSNINEIRSKLAIQNLPHSIFSFSPQEGMPTSLKLSRIRFFLQLQEFNLPLQSMGVRLVLASQIIDRYEARESVRGLWQVHSNSTLVAVVDFDRNAVALRPDTHFLELDCAAWQHRSAFTNIPESFQKYPLELLLWDYSHRTRRELFPSRHLDRLITLRRHHRLHPSMMNDLEILLLTHLHQTPMTAHELAGLPGMDVSQCKRALGALFFAGVIAITQPSIFSKIASLFNFKRPLVNGVL